MSRNKQQLQLSETIFWGPNLQASGDTKGHEVLFVEAACGLIDQVSDQRNVEGECRRDVN